MKHAIVTKTSKYFKSKGIILPTISELQNPNIINDNIKVSLKKVHNNKIDPLNLFRVHWFNKKDQSGFSNEPEHIVLPSGSIAILLSPKIREIATPPLQ